MGAVPIRPIAVAGGLQRSLGWYDRRSRWLLGDRSGPEPAGEYLMIPGKEDMAQFRAAAERRGLPWPPPAREDAVWRPCVDLELSFGPPICSRDLIVLAEKSSASLLRLG
jgi:hypothetical protein